MTYHDGERSSIHDDIENNAQDPNKHRSLFCCMQKIQRAEDHHRHEYHLDHHSYCDLSLYKYQNLNQIRISTETI